VPPQNSDEESKQLATASADEEHDEYVPPQDAPAEPVDPEEAALNEHRMSLLEHLSELRVRLRNAGIAFLLAMVGSFYFVDRFFEVLTRPVRKGMEKAGFPGGKLHVLRVTEPFWVYMKLAIIAGVIIASPFVFWELWKFVAPGLYKKERRLAALVTGATAACFAGGAVFAYFVLCQPAAYYMMSLLKPSFKTPVPLDLTPTLMMDEVADFLMMTLAGCGVAFELPVVVAILGALGLVTTKTLWKFNKYALVLSTVLGAVLTPSTDPFTQMLLAGPLFLLYEVSILMVFIIERTRKRRDADLEKEYGSSSSDSDSSDSSDHTT
jgi:sec-independent protein translocase protein TatC